MNEGLIFEHYPARCTDLPKGWEICSISQICRDVISGFACGTHNSAGRGVPQMRPMNIDREGRLDLSELKYVEGEIPRELANGDVVFNNTNSPELVGKTTLISIGSRLAFSNHMTRIRVEHPVSARFLAHQLHFLWMSGYFRHRCVNHVNQASISAEPLSESVPILLPPAGEQERITDLLDELMPDLDAAIRALKRVQNKLDHYRTAVLKAAFAGELTSEWRDQHRDVEPVSDLLERILNERRHHWEEAQLRKFAASGKEPPKNWKAKFKEPVAPDKSNLPALPRGWCWATLDQLTVFITSGSRGWKEFYVPEGAIFIRSQDIRTDRLVLDGAAYVRPPKNKEGTRTAVQSGDLLVTITGANVAKAALVDIDISEAYVSQHVGLIKLVDGQLGSFIHAYVVSPSGGRKRLLALAYGAGKPGLNLDHLRELPVPLAPRSEVEVIVEMVNNQLSIVQHLEADLKTRLKSAQTLRHATLRHAFTGQLVAQDPKDESAAQLLKRVADDRQMRERQTAAPKTTGEDSPARRNRATAKN
jgi:type I restriction enzyme S subunit